MVTTAIIDSLNPLQLSRLLKLDAPCWTKEERASILHHQLKSALLPGLALMPELASEIASLQEIVQPPKPTTEVTFLDELTAAVPQLQLLQAIKRFARQFGEDAASPLYGEPATVLYYAALAAALSRCGTHISRLPDQQLLSGFEWAAKQEGAEALGGLFHAALLQITKKDTSI